MVVIGVDLGTSGLRMVALGQDGTPAGQVAIRFADTEQGAEQDPRRWWQAFTAAGRLLAESLQARGEKVAALAVASTSGSVVGLDAAGEPLAPALLYFDPRADAEAEAAGVALAAEAEALGYRLDASFGLPKVLYLRRTRPAWRARLHRVTTPSGYLEARLLGHAGPLDWTNALKLGYDLLRGEWPATIESVLGLPLDQLPPVVAPGTLLGPLDRRAAAELGWPAGTPVVAGMTDGCASQLGSGAARPGQKNTSLGTTLVVKAITRELPHDPDGVVYSHRHPLGYWMPGGASNTGGGILRSAFPGADLAELDATVDPDRPSPHVLYPLPGTGERFPFRRPQATAFRLGPPGQPAYQSYLEGVAFVERLAYERLAALGIETEPVIYATGGGSESAAWNQLRANITGQELVRPALTGADVGAALLAAGHAWHGDVVQAAAAMVRPAARYRPRTDAFEAAYARFREELVRRGWWP
ncbi:MAG: FGGY-family carbohydrate kinase [Firmicutes bacterium]|nr:FGGY-family carbohydrate kinase [Bacillota bacterium]